MAEQSVNLSLFCVLPLSLDGSRDLVGALSVGQAPACSHGFRGLCRGRRGDDGPRAAGALVVLSPARGGSGPASLPLRPVENPELEVERAGLCGRYFERKLCLALFLISAC